MAIAAATCWFSAVPSTGCATNHRHFSTSPRLSYLSCVSKPSDDRNQIPERGKVRKSPCKSSIEDEAIIQKLPPKSTDENPFPNVDVRKGRSKTGQSQSTASRNKGSQEIIINSKEQQVEASNLHNDSLLNAVVKVYCTHTAPDYSLPWQKRRHYTSTGSAFMIGNEKLLTNAHCVEHNTQVKVKRRGDDKKYIAKVLAKGVECDIALLSVESKEFWRETEPLHFGHLPNLQDAVTVVGYPLGGETISVTKGVVSRIEVTSYAHGSSELLGIQIDAAINPGNSGGPAFNDKGECVGVAFQGYNADDVENIGYVIPTAVVSHFLEDYERNGKYTGFPSLGVLLQRLENPALLECLHVPAEEGVLVRKVEPLSGANNVLKEGDIIVTFDNVRVGCEGTVPFRSSERIAFRYLISKKFTGDVATVGILRRAQFRKVQVILSTREHLVPYHIDGDQPSYLIVAGLVFTPLSEPLIESEEGSIGLKLLTKARFSMPRFKGEQIVVLSQVLAHEVNIGYEDILNEQILKFNGTWIRNIHHLAHLVDSCKNRYFVFEFGDNFMVVLKRKSALAASKSILKDYAIPSERSPDLLEPFVDSVEQNVAVKQKEFGDNAPFSSSEAGFEGLLWA